MRNRTFPKPTSLHRRCLRLALPIYLASEQRPGTDVRAGLPLRGVRDVVAPVAPPAVSPTAQQAGGGRGRGRGQGRGRGRRTDADAHVPSPADQAVMPAPALRISPVALLSGSGRVIAVAATEGAGRRRPRANPFAAANAARQRRVTGTQTPGTSPLRRVLRNAVQHARRLVQDTPTREAEAAVNHEQHRTRR
jgi:hypothetical protein